MNFIKLAKQTALVATVCSATLLGHAATYEFDPGHANVRFYVDHFGTSTNAGGFYGLEGQLEYNPDARTGFVGVTIPIAKLSTGFKPFDNHLKSADFFNVNEYPTAYFRSTNWQFSGDEVTAVNGELTLLDQTHPVTLTAQNFNCYDSPILNKFVCGGDFETTIDRTEWGIDKYAVPNEPNNIRLVIQIEAALAE